MRRNNFFKSIKVLIKRDDGSETNLTGEVEPDAVAAINEDLDAAFQFVDRSNLGKDISDSKIKQVRIDGVVLGTSERSIPHGLGVNPTYTVYPKSAVVWYETRIPDQTNIFLAAADTLTVDIVAKG